ncbi:MAG TPA: hypothetical protein VFG04_28605 [Planctomycetaceae bacterium]|jgi:hypothetical protein|nr:hypothetical protein [Planctomycetaceae bacterium]
MICQRCGSEAPTKLVNFYQNIGAIVIRFPRSTKCHLCKQCVHQVFWKYTLVNSTLGWWGMISVFVTPIYLLSNTVQYLLCLGMPTGPQGETETYAHPAPDVIHEDLDSVIEALPGEIVKCPHCRMRVCVTADGTCPSCRQRFGSR